MFLNEDKNWLVLWVLVIFLFGYIEIGDVNFMDISSGFRNVLEDVDVISIEIFDVCYVIKINFKIFCKFRNLNNLKYRYLFDIYWKKMFLWNGIIIDIVDMMF